MMSSLLYLFHITSASIHTYFSFLIYNQNPEATPIQQKLCLTGNRMFISLSQSNSYHDTFLQIPNWTESSCLYFTKF